MIEPLMERPARLSHANPTRTLSAVVMMKTFKPKWNREVVSNNPLKCNHRDGSVRVNEKYCARVEHL